MDYDQAMEGFTVSYYEAAAELLEHGTPVDMGPSGELLAFDGYDWCALPLRSDAILIWLGY